MPAPLPRPAGDALRRAADLLYELAERVDVPRAGLAAAQELHDAIEAVAGDVRAVVRGRGFR